MNSCVFAYIMLITFARRQNKHNIRSLFFYCQFNKFRPRYTSFYHYLPGKKFHTKTIMLKITSLVNKTSTVNSVSYVKCYSRRSFYSRRKKNWHLALHVFIFNILYFPSQSKYYVSNRVAYLKIKVNR